MSALPRIDLSPDPTAEQIINNGFQLGILLFPEPLRTALTLASENERLEIRLHFPLSNHVQIAHLPWEFARLDWIPGPIGDEKVGESLMQGPQATLLETGRGVIVTRQAPSETPYSRPAKRDLQNRVDVATVRGREQLNTGSEFLDVDALSASVGARSLTRSALASAGAGNPQSETNVVVFAGHGSVPETAAPGFVTARNEMMTFREVANLVNVSGAQVCILAACHGASALSGQVSLGEAVAGCGVPVVIGFHGELEWSLACMFVERFVAACRAGSTLFEALDVGRRSMRRPGHHHNEEQRVTIWVHQSLTNTLGINLNPSLELQPGAQAKTGRLVSAANIETANVDLSGSGFSTVQASGNITGTTIKISE
jgi:hypothetical protein